MARGKKLKERLATGNKLSHALFGRGWAMKRITDGERGSKCYMTPVEDKNTVDLVRKLEWLGRWIDHFGLKTVIGDIIDWAEVGPHQEPLYVNQQFARSGEDVPLGLFPE